ncbi:MAG: TolC family protein [Bacteroidales bacterium]|nr:TolC family protein [Bacteroidales bacterium]
MTKKKSIFILISLFITLFFQSAMAQQPAASWTLRACIDYALANNIQIKKLNESVKSIELDLEAAKASLYPSLSASANQSYTHQKAQSGSPDDESNSLTGNYSIRSSVLLYNGNKLKNTIELQALTVQSAGLNQQATQNNIELEISSLYLQVLYAREALVNAENNQISTQSQVDRAKILYDAGSISESTYMQLVAQLSEANYSVVSARTSLERQLLNLKQMLELNINEPFDIAYPEIDDDQVLSLLPEKQQVYISALGFMPELQNGQLAVGQAQIAVQIAEAGKLPTLAMDASLASGYSSLSGNQFATQLGNNFYQNAGLTLSIPIYSNKQVKTAVSKAKISQKTAELDLSLTRKTVLHSIENAYLDASSAQSRFVAAKDQLKASKISYDLINEQFRLGMKNSVDLLTEKTLYLNAQQEYLQAKYTTVLNQKILDFYRQKRIEL